MNRADHAAAVFTDRVRNRGLRIVKELTGFKRNRVFAYAPYVELLSEGKEPIR